MKPSIPPSDSQRPADGSDNSGEPSLRVYGTVRDQFGDPLDGVTVQAIDRDLRSEQLLGSTRAQGGRYEIRYSRSQFLRAEKDAADLVMTLLGPEGQEIHRTPIHYNVADEVEIDVSLQEGEYRGPSEWETLTNSFLPLLEDVAPQDLREDDRYQDVSFLSGETGSPRLTIGTWSASYRLAARTAGEETPLPAEVFYAFLRQGEPSIFNGTLLDDMQDPDRVALIEDKLLRSLVAIPADRQRTLLAQAIAGNLVPARITPRLPDVLNALDGIRVRYAADINIGGGKGTLGQMLALTSIGRQQSSFLSSYTAHTGSMEDFWKKLESDKVLSAATVQQVRLTLELGELTRNHPPLVGALLQSFQRGELKSKRDLAKLSRDDWKSLFKRPGPDGKPVGVPANTDGDTPDQQMEQFAYTLDRRLERSYPTASFAAKLGRVSAPGLPSPKGLKSGGDLVRFLGNNPEFQLDRFRVDHYLADNANALEGIGDKTALLADLKSTQRVFKLKPTFQAVTALLDRKIDSAQQIYFMGPGQFATALADSGLNKLDAQSIYRKAESTYALALALFGDYNLAMNGASPFAVPSQTPSLAAQSKIATLPNLQTLFGSLDYCECTYCRSVYSPAAYFVDILRFLGERGSVVNPTKNVRQVLLDRRPDLGEIELSCENTNTPLPYIDLVNEVLEDVVSPPAGVQLNNFILPDLVAGPIRPSVRNELTAKGFPIAADAQVYAPDARGQWAIRDTQQSYKVVGTGVALLLLPTRQTSLSAAELRANPERTNQAAYNKLRLEVFPLSLPFDLWQVQVRAYLGHLGVPQPRLLRLFQQKGADGVTLSPSDVQVDCAWLGLTETDRKIVTGTLAGKQPWDFWGLGQTTNSIPDPQNPAAPNVTGPWTTVLSNVNVLLHRSGLEYKQLLQVLDMRYVNPAGSVFIFDTADSNAASCDTSKFVVRNLTEDALTRMHRFIRLWRKLGCAMWELDLLLPDANPDPNVTDKRITDAVLQDLARMSRLRELPGLDWRALYSLYNSIDNNLYVDRGQEGAPAVQTLYQRLFRNRLVVDAAPSFPASPDQVAGSLGDRVPSLLAAFRIKEADLDLILADLHLTKTSPLNATVLSQIYRIAALAQALGLDVDSFLRLKRLWAEDPFASTDATRRFVELARQVAASDFSVLELDYLLAHRFTLSSGVALEDKAIVAVLQALREGLQKIGDDLSLNAEATGVLLQTQKEAFIRQKVAEVLQLDVPSAGALLTGLRLKGATVPLLQSINDPRLLAKLAGGAYQLALDEAGFPAIFQSLRLLHKDALMIGKLRLAAAEVSWWLDGTHAADMGWMSPKDFPIDTTSQVDVRQWVAMRQFFTWKAGLPKSDLTAFDFATRVLDTARTSASNLADLAQLTAWDAADLGALATAFHWVNAAAGFDALKQELRKSANLLRLAEAMAALRRLGVNAARALQWAKAEPDSTDAASLKQTVKAKYGLPQWQQVIQPLQDGFREQQRQALVGWLMTHANPALGQGWTDADGLYSYFLIDVEMSACMLTSRLKQAAASAQLFVQRCLMNLEVDVLAKADLDPKWKQWQWMKRFRVWEANRKVFLYPENWIEPELRDEKSPFFKDLENELMQNDVTSETAEDAYLNYLEKMDKVANLEIRTMFNQIISQDQSVMHVFGRTRSSQAPENYYRQRIDKARWTPWEKVDLDIQSNHLVAGMHNRRLYLLWPQFLEKSYPPPVSIPTPQASSSGIIVQPSKYWEVRMFWSELKKGKWTPKVLSDSPAIYPQVAAGGDHLENVEFRLRLSPNVQLWMYSADNPNAHAPCGQWVFEKSGKQVTPQRPAAFEYLISPAVSQYVNNLIRHNTEEHFFYYSVVQELEKSHVLTAHENAVAIKLLNNVRPGLTYTVIDAQAQGFVENSSFFVWDPSRTYFVDYNWHTETAFYSGALHVRTTSTFKFFIHYHPFVELFIRELNLWGIGGLLNRRIQVSPASVPSSPTPFNFTAYQPDPNVVAPLPVEDVDFTYAGAYSPYNWELFFHVPFFIANKLSANQRFEEALSWFHYIFDPTSTDTTTLNPDTPQQKFWITKPFYQTTKADYYQQKIENILLAIAKGDVQLKAQVRQWRDNPFNPHLIARLRTVSYQKNVLIKYVQTLIAWGDQLFGQDTIETINEATQLYILASSILGPRPRSIPKKVANPIKTFYQLQQEGLDEFGNALKQVENLLPSASSGGSQSANTPELPRLDVLYFCIPNNEKLLALWDTVADRLFKIRHCMNLEGVTRQLPLFEPPIDPALLVKAAAAGLDIGAVLSDTNAPAPLYRFPVMMQRAQEICAEVKALGAAMLAALERRDAEAFALLRSSHESLMLEQVRGVKSQQIDEAARIWEALQETRKIVDARRGYYEGLSNDGWSPGEQIAFGLSTASTVLDAGIAAGYLLAGGLRAIPNFIAGASGFGGSPHITVDVGGEQAGGAAELAVRTLSALASAFEKGAALALTASSYSRRAAEWDFQKQVAEKELPQVDKQIAAADIRRQIATQELANQDRQIENAQKEDDFMRGKFTNRELHDWMINQLSIVYFQSYQLAYDLAKRVERSFRYELGLGDSSYVQFGYWDSLKKGLLAGEKLFYDLKRLEAAYYEQNRREYELTKHISLAQLDPVALLKLRQNGECFVDVPETVFDMDYPGHYFRRIRSVGLSIPCTVGPYTTVACTLTLTSNHLRKDATLLANKYPRDLTADDPRFRDEIAAVQSIATSSAQTDHGLFELSFRDERYLPFEGAGAISSWHVKLNKDFPQLDFSTISDVILHLSYTAREGGELLRSKAIDHFNQTLNALALAESRHGLYRVFNLRHEYSAKWYRFLHPANPADEQALLLDDLADRLPYFTRPFTTKKARQIEVVALTKDNATYKVMFTPLGSTPADLLPLVQDPAYLGLLRGAKDLTGNEASFGAWTLKVRLDGATDFKSLPADAIQELFLIVGYTVA